MRSSFVTVVFAIIGCIAMCRAQDDIAATGLTITAPDPTSGGFTVGTATTITFTVTFTVSGSVTPTSVGVCFTDDNTLSKSTEVTASGGPDGSTPASGTEYAGLEASLTLDAANCNDYTQLCASFRVTDDNFNNDMVCIEFGAAADKAGTKTCNDITATALTVTVPDPTSGGFTAGTSTPTTFTVTFTLKGSVTPTDVKLYFSNAAGSTKSTEVTAGGSNAPDGSTAASGTTYADLTASLTLDATNCAAYTKLCASITVADDDTTNNAVCIDFGTTADKAGTKTCSDIAASTLTVTAPAPAANVFYIGEAVTVTFTLAYTVTVSGGSPSDVKAYFSNADGSTKSTEVTASGTNAPDGSAVTSSGSYVGLTATLNLDVTNCANYTKVCSSITVTDADATNNAACGDFGTDATNVGTKNCTAATTESPTESKAEALSVGFVTVITMMVASVLA
ncbi:mucin-22-like [Ptychodera flava]|uniref:mucin-22-like n=1 Tax=Ptychodera flava TaxID=63121 RepID=UPI00396A31C8